MTNPIIYWTRRDFRLGDNPALSAAAASGRPVIPVFILDEVAESHGACPKWRLGLGAEAFGAALAGVGSKLVFRRGAAQDVLLDLIAETGADEVHWTRLYDPDAIARDTGVKAALKAADITAESHPGHLLFEPWEAETKAGGIYRVYSPFWRAVKDKNVPALLPVPGRIEAPDVWPKTEDPATWNLAGDMRRGAPIVAGHLCLGEAAAADRLAHFVETRIGAYKDERNFPAVPATSKLSENLTYGEISPRSAWHAGMRAMHEGQPGAEHFLKELVWREFAYHLIYHTPEIATRNWREGWDSFPWREDSDAPEVLAWTQGRTGIPLVDAAMRELYVTGLMHNRTRMIAASYLTKHMLCHWKIGQAWFAECLIDWDPASNAMGWQWVAGSGPDAAPYFRIFNPLTQQDKFDPDAGYTHRWVAELAADPGADARAFFEATPKAWGLSASDPYPDPIVDLKVGRDRALEAYSARAF